MKPLIVIAGPTATGKSKTAVALAKRINGAVVSCDSMQVYRKMDIGTAKVTREEMDGVDHYLIDVLDPDEPFSVAVFQKMAQEAIDKIHANGQIPILAGGTGFYIQSVVRQVDFTENDDDKSYRESLEAYVAEVGEEAVRDLHRRLSEVDPDSAAAIHPNNIKRVIRALEYHHLTGEAISVHNVREQERKPAYDLAFYVLSMDRKLMYSRINDRVDEMVGEGLVSEVEKLLQEGYGKELVSMQGLGYKEIVGYLEGIYDLDTAVEILKRDTRRFAKRQLTWFRREKDVHWISLENTGFDPEATADYILKDIEEKHLL